MNELYVGIYRTARNGGMVEVDHRKYPYDIAVSARLCAGAHDGDKVVVEVTRHATRVRKPSGRIVEVLGRAGENETEMHAILAEFGLPYGFPPAIEEEAEAIPGKISDEEIYRRRDMRDRLTFTIDPADAKDFDDALSFHKCDDNTYEIGVHIADVTHYIASGSALDEEAFQRGTSVYLVDRTIPMLPERLCNQLCSLRPNEDKLCMSVVFTMNDKGEVLKHKVCRTVIRSNKRLTYEEAFDIMNSPTSNVGEIHEALVTLNRIAKKIREVRFRHGAIDFERDEIKVEVDAEGKPIGFHMQVMTDANHLIEEFMLLANKTIATDISNPAGHKKNSLPMVYRVHDVPDSDRLKSLTQFVRRFGYRMKTADKTQSITKNIKRLLSDCKNKPEQEMIQTLTIRTMAKAVYTTDNIGHYGLAFPYYTHFTSPIRRYPDMMVHRLVAQYLLGNKEKFDKQATYPNHLANKSVIEESCKHSSDQEQLAANAERASVKFKQAEWMEAHVGEQFDGVISGVQEYGVYVELNDIHCEGLVPMRELSRGDFWVYNESNYCIVSEKTGKKLTLGDPIRVTVLSAEPLKRRITFSCL